MLESSRVAEARRADRDARGAESQLSEDRRRPRADRRHRARPTTCCATRATDSWSRARCRNRKGAGMEIAAIDRGPGMDLERCLADGFSTGGTPGTGLGAVRRLSDSFDAYSLPAGSIAVARVAGQRRRGTERAREAATTADRRGLPAHGRRRDVGRRLGRRFDGGRPDADHRGRRSRPRPAGRRRQHRRAEPPFTSEAPSGRGPAEILGEIHRAPAQHARRRGGDRGDLAGQRESFDSPASATWRRW